MMTLDNGATDGEPIPKYPSMWRLPSANSPSGVMSVTMTGRSSTITRKRSRARRASPVRLRSARSGCSSPLAAPKGCRQVVHAALKARDLFGGMFEWRVHTRIWRLGCATRRLQIHHNFGRVRYQGVANTIALWIRTTRAGRRSDGVDGRMVEGHSPASIGFAKSSCSASPIRKCRRYVRLISVGSCDGDALGASQNIDARGYPPFAGCPPVPAGVKLV